MLNTSQLGKVLYHRFHYECLTIARVFQNTIATGVTCLNPSVLTRKVNIPAFMYTCISLSLCSFVWINEGKHLCWNHICIYAMYRPYADSVFENEMHVKILELELFGYAIKTGRMVTRIWSVSVCAFDSFLQCWQVGIHTGILYDTLLYDTLLHSKGVDLGKLWHYN